MRGLSLVSCYFVTCYPTHESGVAGEQWPPPRWLRWSAEAIRGGGYAGQTPAHCSDVRGARDVRLAHDATRRRGGLPRGSSRSTPELRVAAAASARRPVGRDHVRHVAAGAGARTTGRDRLWHA